jgi:MFS family permease
VTHADPGGAPPKHDPYAALRLRDFRWYIVSLFTMTLATQMQAVVVGWQVYDLTHDPLSLGLVGLAEALPFIALALPAGHLADLVDRRHVSMIGLTATMLCSLALLVLTAGGVVHAGHVWPIYATIFAMGIARSFLQPARQAFGIDIVPRPLYPNAVAWRSSTWQTAAVAGPALGGLLYGFTSITTTYLVVAAFLVVSVAGFGLIPSRHEPRVAPAQPTSMADSLLVGLRFVFREPVLLSALALDLFSVLLGGAEALLPVFAREILHVGPQGLGLLRAAPAAGAVVIGVALAHRPPFRHAGRTLLLAVAAFATGIIIFGLSRSFWLSLGVLAFCGMADGISVVIRSTLLQTLTPKELLGRVSAVNSIFIGSANEIGAFESGVTARLFGTVPAVLLGGIASLAVVGIIAARVPKLRRLGRIDRHAPAGT